VAGDADAAHDLVALGHHAGGEDQEVQQEHAPPDLPGTLEHPQDVVVERLLRHAWARARPATSSVTGS
jgi:hypothetical protein